MIHRKAVTAQELLLLFSARAKTQIKQKKNEIILKLHIAQTFSWWYDTNN